MAKTIWDTKTDVSVIGYERVHLAGRRYYVHRLIAEQNIPNPTNLPFVNHKDGNKLNNNISNLEWCTPGDNVRHAHKMGLMKPYKGPRTWLHKAIINSDGEKYKSITKAASVTNTNRSSIMNCLAGKYHTAGGKKWSYL